MKHGMHEISLEQLSGIQQTVQNFPKLSRTALADTVCEYLQWYSASGALKRQSALKLLERLDRDGVITLPQKHNCGRKNPDKPPECTERTVEGTLLACTFEELPPVELRLLSDKADIALWNEYVQRYHPQGHRRPFGHWLRYFVCVGENYLGCLLISAASKTLRARDKWLDWTPSQRRRNLPWVINNSRYLLFRWVNIPHLASHILGQLAKRVAGDWEQRWGYRPVLMETFIDTTYKGTCYRAAGWQELGMTTGEGAYRPGSQYTTSPKHILVKPLHRQYQSLLTSEQLQGRIIQ